MTTAEEETFQAVTQEEKAMVNEYGRREFDVADVAEANAILYALKKPLVKDSDWYNVDQVIGRIADVLRFIQNNQFDGYLQYVNMLELIENPPSKDSTSKESIPFFHGIHLRDDETKSSYDTLKELVDLQKYEDEPEFLQNLTERFNAIADCHPIDKWLLFEKILKSRSNIHHQVQTEYSKAVHTIFNCMDSNEQELASVRHNINFWRLKDLRFIEDIVYINYIDNLICFLCFEQDFPELFSPADHKASIENKDDFNKKLAHIKSSPKANNLQEEEEEEDDVILQKEAAFPVYAILLIIILLIGIISIIVLWNDKTQELLLSNVGNICQVTNQKLEVLISSFVDNVKAASYLVKRELIEQYNLADLLDNQSWDIDQFFFHLMDIYSLRGIYVTDKASLFTYAGIYSNGSRFVMSHNASKNGCIWMYGVEKTPSGYQRNISDKLFLRTCTYDRTIRWWYPSSINASEYWTTPYDFLDGQFGTTYIGFDVSDGAINTALGIDIRLQDVYDNAFDLVDAEYDGFSFATWVSDQTLVGSTDLDSDVYTTTVMPQNSKNSLIRAAALELQNFVTLPTSVSNSTSYGPFKTGSYLQCANYYSSLTLPVWITTAFPTSGYLGSYQHIYASSIAMGVICCFFALATMILSQFVLKTVEKHQDMVIEQEVEIASIQVPRKSVDDSKQDNNEPDEKLIRHQKRQLESHSKQAKLTQRNFNIFCVSISLIFILLILVWAIWSAFALSQVKSTAEVLSTEAAATLKVNVENYISTVESAAQTIRMRYTEGVLNDVTELSDIQRRDQVITDVLKAFQTTSSIIYGIFVAYESGRMTGIFVNETAPNGFVARGLQSTNGKGETWYSVNSLGKRNINDTIYQSSTAYYPTEQTWYLNATEWSGTMLFGSPIVFDNTYLTVILSFPLYDTSSILAGVGGVVVKLSEIGEKFSSASFGVSSQLVTWLMESNGTLVASSDLEDLQTITNITYTLTGATASDSTISSSSAFLSTYYGGDEPFSSISGLASITRSFESPLTQVNSIVNDSLNLAWYHVITFERDGFYGEIEKRADLTAMVLFLVCILVGYVANLAFSYIKSATSVKSADDSILSKDLTSKVASEWYERVFPMVIQAFASTWKRDRELSNRPISIEVLEKKRLAEGKARFFDARAGNDIAVVCFMESQPTWVFRLWKWNTGIYNRLLVKFFLCIHYLVPFTEQASAEQLQQNGLPLYSGIIELFCLLVEFQDAFSKTILLVKSLRVKHPMDNLKRRLLFAVILDVILILIFIDVILAWSIRFSYEYYIPLKVFVILLEVEEVRNMLVAFIKTILRAREVFILYFSLILVASAMGHILFRTTVNPDSVVDSWASFPQSFITAFIFISTSDNYTNCVYSAKSQSPFYIAYFIFFTIFGRLFIIALVLSFFQDGFTETFRDALLALRRKDRLGLIGSFILIDVNTSGTVDKGEFWNFVRCINEFAKKEDVDSIFDELDVEQAESKGVLTIKEFVVGVEKSSRVKIDNENFEPHWTQSDVEDIEHDSRHEAPNNSAIFAFIEMIRWRLYPIVSSSSFDTFVLCCIIIQVGILSLYGTWSNYTVLDYCNGAVVLVNTLDVCLKIFVYRKAYFQWSHFNFRTDTGRFVSGDSCQEFANRLDFVVVFISFILFVISRTAAGGFSFDEGEDSLRFAMTFPVLRLFTQIKSTLVLMYTLYVIIPQFTSLIVLALLLFFVYAVYGVLLFRNQFSLVLQSAAPDGNFDSLSESFLCLFQLFTGQGWSDVLYAAILTKSTYSVSIYFITYTIIMTMLVVNIVTALILTVSQRIAGMKNISPEQINESLME